MSAVLHPGEDSSEPQRGYSCFDSPWKLLYYVRDHFKPQEKVVKIFKGERVGTGPDSEPLVVPDVSSTRTLSWNDFLDELEAKGFYGRPVSREQSDDIWRLRDRGTKTSAADPEVHVRLVNGISAGRNGVVEKYHATSPD